MGIFDERDRALITMASASLKDLAEAIRGDKSFHNRQVPALRRQTKALELIREKKAAYQKETLPVVTRDMVVILLNKIEACLLNS